MIVEQLNENFKRVSSFSQIWDCPFLTITAQLSRLKSIFPSQIPSIHCSKQQSIPELILVVKIQKLTHQQIFCNGVLEKLNTNSIEISRSVRSSLELNSCPSWTVLDFNDAFLLFCLLFKSEEFFRDAP